MSSTWEPVVNKVEDKDQQTFYFQILIKLGHGCIP